MDKVAVIPQFDHIGIQCRDLDTATAWYCAFLGCEVSWTLDTFSATTHERLPGIRELRELVVADFRLHLFNRAHVPETVVSPHEAQYQHLCLSVVEPQDLLTLRDRWMRLASSGLYQFASSAPPSGIVTDSDGVQSLYLLDPNGLELEFTWKPAIRSEL